MAPGPGPFAGLGESFAPGILSAGVDAIQNGRVVRQRRAIPGQRGLHVGTGALIGKPVHSPGVERQMKTVGMAMTADFAAAFEAGVMSALSEHGEALACE